MDCFNHTFNIFLLRHRYSQILTVHKVTISWYSFISRITCYTFTLYLFIFRFNFLHSFCWCPGRLFISQCVLQWQKGLFSGKLSPKMTHSLGNDSSWFWPIVGIKFCIWASFCTRCSVLELSVITIVWIQM